MDNFEKKTMILQHKLMQTNIANSLFRLSIYFIFFFTKADIFATSYVI